MKHSEVKLGAVLYYVIIIVNAVYGLIVAPFMISTVGVSEYGVYKTIGSLTAAIAVVDLGLGGTMQRYIANFNSKKDEKNCSNFSAMGFVQAVVIAGVIAIIGVVLYPTLDKMYSGTFSVGELELAKQLFILSIVYVIIHVFENIISGIVTGYNKFIFSNSVKVVVLFLRMGLYYVLLPILKSALVIIGVTILLELCIILLQLWFIKCKIGLKIKLHFFDKKLFKESIIYTMFMFVQSIMGQVNSNVDNILIGAMVSPKAVSIYSFGIMIFGMFQALSTSISGVMLPTVTNKINSGADSTELEDLVIQVGSMQFFLSGSCLCAFYLIGQEFIQLWLGNGFEDVWIITMILMIPAIFELSVNVCISVLRARNKIGFRTIALLIGTILNVVITCIGIKMFGYIAAAVGTAISTIVASLVMVNIYYIKAMKLNMFRIYYNIIIKQAPILFIASVGTFVVKQFVSEYSWISFITKGIVFVIIEIICIGIVWIVKKQRDNMIKL